MARADKAAAVAEITESFRDASAAVLTEYRGLTVAELKELRRALSGQARYAVVKNTLTRIAVREAGVAELEPLLEGPSAIAFVTGDPVAVAKGIRDFARNHPALVVKGGLLEGRALSADEIRKLADLESREVLLAKVAGGLMASLQQAVSLFAAPLSQMARLAGALQAQLPAAEEPAAEEPAAEASAHEPADAATGTDPNADTDTAPSVDTASTDSETTDSETTDSETTDSETTDSETTDSGAAADADPASPATPTS